MSEGMFISSYKGFDLWDYPERPYPVKVMIGNWLVNNFSDTNEAMKVIDGMDAYTVNYHKHNAADTAAAAATGVTVGTDTLEHAKALISAMDVEVAALQAHIATLRTERDAARAAQEPFAEDYHRWLADNREETYLEFLNRTRDSDNVAVSAAIGYKLLHGDNALATARPASEDATG